MKKKILVVDDDADLLALTKTRLQASGYKVLALSDSAAVMEQIAAFNPDLVVLDLIMPKVSGIVLLKEIREEKKFDHIKIIVNSSKNFQYDYNYCLEAGADAYLVKPVKHEQMTATIRKILTDEMTLTFWGTRGSIARPGKDTLKYGGNTPCISVELSKDRLFIFDAGTGITNLGRNLITTGKRYKLNLFITHPHWDHIQGLPFFQPLYQQGNELAIHGTSHGKRTLQQVISGQMDTIYFPVTLKQFSARVYFKELVEGDYEIENLKISTLGLNHPGVTLGYRLTNNSGKVLAYITDNELVPGADPFNRNRLVNFVKNADILIHDANYFDHEYPEKFGWGHSGVGEVIKLAEDAKVKRLYLFHHDPSHDDAALEQKEAIARRYFKDRKCKIECHGAMEGHSISI